jgi:hypothetical protein
MPPASYGELQIWRTFLEHPTAAWTAQQLVDTFPDDSPQSYLLRDRDRVYGEQFRDRAHGIGIAEVLTAPHSPWQNPFAERLIGSIRRECLNHVSLAKRSSVRQVIDLSASAGHNRRS